MNKKGIKIDLSIFFDDERKMSIILVDPLWKNVACLQKRVELLFNVEPVRFLGDGCFLPPQESIEIIKFFNDIKAFVPNEALEKRKKKKLKKCRNLEKSEDFKNGELVIAVIDQQKIDVSQKKRKFNSLQNNHNHSSSYLSNNAKRSKNADFIEATNAGEKMAPKPESISKTFKTKVSDISSDLSDSEEATEKNPPCGSRSEITENLSNSEENTLIAKIFEDNRRHSSTPKEKKSKVAENNVEKTCPSSIISSTFLNESKRLQQSENGHRSSNSPNSNNPFNKPNSSREHIYFNYSGETVSPATEEKSKSKSKKYKDIKTIVIFRCPLNDVTNGTLPQIPRIFHLQSKSIANNTAKKQVVEIQEEIILPPHSIQDATSKFTLTKDKPEETKEKVKETIETVAVHEKISSLNNKSTTTANNDDNEKQVSANNLEVSHDQETNVIEAKNESQMEQTNVDEMSIMSVDCVDLSIDVDEDDIEKQNKKTTEIKPKGNKPEKHDLTADDESCEDDKMIQNKKTTEVKPTKNKLEKHDLTADDESDEDDMEMQNKKSTNIKSKRNKPEKHDLISDGKNYDIEMQEEEATEIELKKSKLEKHDLTADDESNKSSESDIEEISEIIDLNETEDNCTTSIQNSNSFKDIRIDKILPFSADLLDLPKTGDIIIFKVPYKNKYNKIVNSNFIAGKVEYINKRTKSIKILILDGVSELCHMPNQFICNLDDSQNFDKYLQLKLNDMCEAKLFSKF